MSAGALCSHHLQPLLVCSLPEAATPIQTRPRPPAPSKLCSLLHLTCAATPLQGEIVNSEAAPSSAGAAAAPVLPEEPVSLVVEEKLAVVLNKDGGLESMEVQGTMSLQVSA